MSWLRHEMRHASFQSVWLPRIHFFLMLGDFLDNFKEKQKIHSRVFHVHDECLIFLLSKEETWSMKENDEKRKEILTVNSIWRKTIFIKKNFSENGRQHVRNNQMY